MFCGASFLFLVEPVCKLASCHPNRVVIIEFPDIASIKNWYRAPEYQPLIALRRSAATDVMIMLEGL